MRKAADQGYLPAMYRLGFFVQDDDLKTAMKWWEKAADEGHSKAMFELGTRKLDLFFKSVDAEDSDSDLFEDGVVWLLLSGENGCGEAYHRLGMLWWRNAEQDQTLIDQSKEYFRLAAQAGHHSSKQYLMDDAATIASADDERPSWWVNPESVQDELIRRADNAREERATDGRVSGPWTRHAEPY